MIMQRGVCNFSYWYSGLSFLLELVSTFGQPKSVFDTRPRKLQRPIYERDFR